MTNTCKAHGVIPLIVIITMIINDALINVKENNKIIMTMVMSPR
jgi:hypothetical protein